MTENVTLSEDCEASRVPEKKKGAGRNFEFVSPRLLTSANRIRLERASQKQSSDVHKITYDRVKRCREGKINTKSSERVNVDVFTLKQTAVSPTQPPPISFVTDLSRNYKWNEAKTAERVIKQYCGRYNDDDTENAFSTNTRQSADGHSSKSELLLQSNSLSEFHHVDWQQQFGTPEGMVTRKVQSHNNENSGCRLLYIELLTIETKVPCSIPLPASPAILPQQATSTAEIAEALQSGGVVRVKITTKAEQRAYIKTAARRGRNARECHAELWEALDNHTIPQRCSCKVGRGLQAGKRVNSDLPRSGRAVVDQCLKDDTRWTGVELAQNRHGYRRHGKMRQPQKHMIVSAYDSRVVLVCYPVREGCTVNAQYYMSFLRYHLRHAVREKRPEMLGDDILWGWEVLPQPSYSPELSPCDYDLISEVKRPLRGKRFANNQDIVTAVRRCGFHGLLDISASTPLLPSSSPSPCGSQSAAGSRVPLDGLQLPAESHTSSAAKPPDLLERRDSSLPQTLPPAAIEFVLEEMKLLHKYQRSIAHYRLLIGCCDQVRSLFNARSHCCYLLVTGAQLNGACLNNCGPIAAAGEKFKCLKSASPPNEFKEVSAVWDECSAAGMEVVPQLVQVGKGGELYHSWYVPVSDNSYLAATDTFEKEATIVVVVNYASTRLRGVVGVLPD
ncbi:hypothetical protein PR048_021840 [Dryococelus australis]|uniref:Uncharacterized protein n=1 Tax=Dryococelus australis TaxID=614101 RepID=A0ABQ9GZK5_9NEOP|nr:hypothetical protein PR048_021840 [Dryococelus australis]